MKPDLLLDAITKHVKLTKDEEKIVVSLLRDKKVKKKQYLLQEKEIQKYGFFVLSGCLRSYSIDKNGIEHILQFAPSGWWIGDMSSLKDEKPSVLYIDAVCDSEILLLSNNDQNYLYEAVPKMERFFRLLAESAFKTCQCRLIENLSLPAKDRYESFCRRYPTLIQSLPKKYIASYIGVTPEFLSKVTG